ncbi:MAG: hypothetical protein QQN63_08090 [Nitrosopumilus sp.]
MIPFYLITNVGTLQGSVWARHFPRHLFLAQVYAGADELYRATVRRIIRRKNTRTIMDNGAFEGHVTDLREYAKIIAATRPDIVVLPDVLEDRMGTISRSEAYLKLASWQPKHYMYVPQGDGIADTLKAYDTAFQELDPGRFIIGIGKSYYHWCGDETERAYESGRVQMVRDIFHITDSNRHRFHLLGGRCNPTQQFTVWTDRFIGLDAYDPCACTLQDSVYPTFDPSRKVNHLSDLEAPGGCLALERNVSLFCNYYGLTAGIDIPERSDDSEREFA